MENIHDVYEHSQEPVLDRKQIAVDLRRLGVDVNFEDWDGLDDNDVLGSIATFAAMYDFDIEKVLSVIVSLEDGEEDDEV